VAKEERNPLRRLDTSEKLEEQAKRDEAQRDLEKGEAERGQRTHAQGQCDQDAVNAMGVDQALEGMAAEDKTDAVYGEDEKPPLKESESVNSTSAPDKDR
jgi:hypothetical protein